jgi:uncharacterized membrane protein
MECYRLTYSLGSMLAQKTAQKAGSRVDRACRCRRFLGKVMPFWYALCLVLMIVEAYLRRHQPALTLLVVAVAIWIATIVYTVTTLVPINNRIARLASALPEGWREEHKRWDAYHRWRILSLTIAMVCLVWGILRQC